MQDIPVFATENGVASLVLKEIPFKGVAYITLRSSLCPKKLLKECVSFCKLAGAQRVFATGHQMLEKYPLWTSVIRMEQLRANIPAGDGMLVTVTEETAEFWRNIYNEKMKTVDTASTITKADMKKYMGHSGVYFVHKDRQCLGIGLVDGDEVRAIATCVPGAGEIVLQALCSGMQSASIAVQVATTNLPAIKLYRRLGFQTVATISRWHTVDI